MRMAIDGVSLKRSTCPMWNALNSLTKTVQTSFTAAAPLARSNCPVSTVEPFEFLGIAVSWDRKREVDANSVLKKRPGRGRGT